MTGATLLLRQVHPNLIQRGRMSSLIFKPKPSDNGKLSVYDGDQISAENSWKHFTNRLKGVSAGVLAVTPGECCRLSLPSNQCPSKRIPEHTVIDFSGETNNSQISRKSKKLLAAAESRGWMYQP